MGSSRKGRLRGVAGVIDHVNGTVRAGIFGQVVLPDCFVFREEDTADPGIPRRFASVEVRAGTRTMAARTTTITTATGRYDMTEDTTQVMARNRAERPGQDPPARYSGSLFVLKNAGAAPPAEL